MDKLLLKQVVLEQREWFESEKAFIYRIIPENLFSTKKIVAIMGVRRCGKSTMLKQISKRAGVRKANYFNFEDERLLKFASEDFNTLLEIFYEINKEGSVFLFDEIQNVEGWEKFVVRLFEGGSKVFVTGSNAKLLSSEISTSLTGRNMRLSLYPFSFKEYLTAQKFGIKTIYTTREKALLSEYLNEYMEFGGFPEVTYSKDKEELIHVYEDIVTKDLIVRFKIRESKSFRELGFFLLSNAGKKISYNNLRETLGFKSTTQVRNYVEFFEQSYLFFTINKFDYSLKKQARNNKKVYCIDTGLSNAVGFKITENRGRILENIVFLELKRRGKQVYYYENKGECDFVVKEGTRINQAIQVTTRLHEENEKRELNGLVEAMKEYNLKEGLIVTLDQEKEVNTEGRKIRVMPIANFLATA